MSVKKAYAKFKKGMDKSAFGIKATTVGKDYGLGDSMFKKGIKKKKAGKGGTPIKNVGGKDTGKYQGGKGGTPISKQPAQKQPARRP